MHCLIRNDIGHGVYWHHEPMYSLSYVKQKILNGAKLVAKQKTSSIKKIFIKMYCRWLEILIGILYNIGSRCYSHLYHSYEKTITEERKHDSVGMDVE